MKKKIESFLFGSRINLVPTFPLIMKIWVHLVLKKQKQKNKHKY